MTNAERIKDRLRKAKDIEALKAVWTEEIEAYKSEESALRIQIKNLKDQRKDDFIRELTNQGAG